jgi:DAK2 domain fusion protein YloV
MTTPMTARDRTRATGADLRAALQLASGWLSANAERINALNVFPVPDGDTGINMSMTLQAAVDGLQRLPEDMPTSLVAQAAYESAMLGARGNSGVILSQLLSGFAKALADAPELTAPLLADALQQASDVAYAAIGKPVEGTILTVAREAARAARGAADRGADLPGLLEQTLAAATAAVAATPTQLEQLRKAGVVDSGGEGYRVILEGAWMFSTGRTLEESTQQRQYSRALLEGIEEPESTYGFCTEFLLQQPSLTVPDMKARMEAMGESVIVVGDANLQRVHVHTLRPGQVLEVAVDSGTLAKVKVENMQLQHQAMASDAADRGDATADGQRASSIGVIAVAAGSGFQKVFRSLGARVVSGGQTMNPSVQEILAAVNSSGYSELVVLPNNTNIVLTARNVKELTPHHVEVVPTETAPQGISALLAFNFQADMQTNVAAMEQAARAVHTVEVTRAVRDAEVDGINVSAGQTMGIYDGRVVCVADTADDALLSTFGRAPIAEMEIVTLYWGAEASEQPAQALAGQIRDAHPALAVEVVEGGQPHYPYVASLE